MHVIKLNGYNATTENGEKLELGTFDSYGEEQLQIVEAPDWVNLNVIATFNPPNKKPVQVAVDSVTGVIKVPKEATADLYGVGTIVFVGLADGVQRISADCEYIVRKHSNASGTEPAEPTPDLLQQVLTLSKDAQAAAKNAEQSAKNAAKDAADTVKPYKEEAVRAATAAAGSANAAENSASAAAGSEQAAGTSELKAAKSEKAAKASEQAASESAQAALESKTAAATSEVNAAASAKKAQDVADSLPEDYTTAVNDIATLKQQVANITLDDSTIGGKPWSSKHIIDMLCPPLEESGNPVVCYPVAGYPLGVKAKWEPVQEGIGTPYPAGGGKNLFNPAWMPKKEVSYGVTWTITPDGTVTANGTTGGTSYYDSGHFLLPAGTYTISAMPRFRISILNADADDATVTAQSVGKPHTFTVENDIQKASLFFATTGTLDNVSAKPQIEKGTTATAWAPYENIRPIKGRDSVTVNRTDELRAWKMLTLDGTENWLVFDAGGTEQFFYTNKYTFDKIPIEKICSHFSNVSFTETAIIRIYTNVFTDASAFSSYLAAQYAAGTPVQIAYKLAESVPFTATGAQALPALAGLNTILTDADSSTVTGRADPIKRITDLEDAVASQT